MNRFLATLLACLLAFGATAAHAEPADIAAAARSVVRIVLVAQNGDDVFYVGHGSGFAVAPDKVVTNAHVVEMLAKDSSLIAGVVPSEGSEGFGAKVIAFSPRNDLALLQIAERGRLTPATLFSGPLGDGADVYAVGYPGTVDLAQGLQLDDIIRPQSPVKTRGTISGGRSAKSFDTILHTASIGGGNSGGPLLDECGRIVGVNSFGTVADGADSEFYFAVSMRELLPFLRKAGIQPRIAGNICRSVDELNRAEAERAETARRREETERRQNEAQQERAERTARRKAELQVISQRENGMALAGLLLALALVATGAGALLYQRGQNRHAMIAGGAAGLLLIGALVTWFLRPSMGEIDDRTAAALPEQAEEPEGDGGPTAGTKLCTVDRARSRITVSEAPDVKFEWSAGGCVNGRTQYGQGSTGWARILVPNEEATVSVVRFDPTENLYRVERYLMGYDQMARAREARSAYDTPTCGAEGDKAREFGTQQDSVRQLLPSRPNEILVYNCRDAESTDDAEDSGEQAVLRK